MAKKLTVPAFSLAVAIASAASAGAADLSVPATYDWTGFYAGVNAGGAGNNIKIDHEYSYVGSGRVEAVSERSDSSQIAFTGGAMLGYNHQLDNIVVGAEADFNFLDFSERRKRDGSFYSETWDVYSTYEASSWSDSKWFGTVRGRLGYAIDNLLIYGTGGLAYGQIQAGGDLNISTSLGSMDWDGANSSTKLGWAAGGGVEYGFDSWTLGAEYLFVDLDTAEWDGNASGPWARANTDLEGMVDYQFSIIRATAKLRF